MKSRVVIISPEAKTDLLHIYNWIEVQAGSSIALGYIQSVERFCLGLQLASERGNLRNDIKPGLRVVGFKKRLTVTFKVDDHKVTILRIFYGGKNWESEFDE